MEDPRVDQILELLGQESEALGQVSTRSLQKISGLLGSLQELDKKLDQMIKNQYIHSTLLDKINYAAGEVYDSLSSAAEGLSDISSSL